MLNNGSLNTFPQKQMRRTLDLILGNGAVNRLSTIQAVYVGSVQSGYKRVEFRSWRFRSCARKENENSRSAKE
jgi:hypothetical protein